MNFKVYLARLIIFRALTLMDDKVLPNHLGIPLDETSFGGVNNCVNASVILIKRLFVRELFLYLFFLKKKFNEVTKYGLGSTTTTIIT